MCVPPLHINQPSALRLKLSIHIAHIYTHSERWWFSSAENTPKPLRNLLTQTIHPLASTTTTIHLQYNSSARDSARAAAAADYFLTLTYYLNARARESCCLSHLPCCICVRLCVLVCARSYCSIVFLCKTLKYTNATHSTPTAPNLTQPRAHTTHAIYIATTISTITVHAHSIKSQTHTHTQ